MRTWRISWRDERAVVDRRGQWLVSTDDPGEVAERVRIMRGFPTIRDVRAEELTSPEVGAR